MRKYALTILAIRAHKNYHIMSSERLYSRFLYTTVKNCYFTDISIITILISSQQIKLSRLATVPSQTFYEFIEACESIKDRSQIWLILILQQFFIFRTFISLLRRRSLGSSRNLPPPRSWGRKIAWRLSPNVRECVRCPTRANQNWSSSGNRA